MIPQDQKQTALNKALDVALKVAESNSDRSPANAMLEFYQKYLQLLEEAQGNKS